MEEWKQGGGITQQCCIKALTWTPAINSRGAEPGLKEEWQVGAEGGSSSGWGWHGAVFRVGL